MLVDTEGCLAFHQGCILQGSGLPIGTSIPTPHLSWAPGSCPLFVWSLEQKHQVSEAHDFSPGSPVPVLRVPLFSTFR